MVGLSYFTFRAAGADQAHRKICQGHSVFQYPHRKLVAAPESRRIRFRNNLKRHTHRFSPGAIRRKRSYPDECLGVFGVDLAPVPRFLSGGPLPADRRWLLLAGVIALPLQPLAFYLVRLPLHAGLTAALGPGALLTAISLFYAPLTGSGYGAGTLLPGEVNTAGNSTYAPMLDWSRRGRFTFTGQRPEANSGASDVYVVNYRLK